MMDAGVPEAWHDEDSGAGAECRDDTQHQHHVLFLHRSGMIGSRRNAEESERQMPNISTRSGTEIARGKACSWARFLAERSSDPEHLGMATVQVLSPPRAVSMSDGWFALAHPQ